jgi:hypothetical protein
LNEFALLITDAPPLPFAAGTLGTCRVIVPTPVLPR